MDFQRLKTFYQCALDGSITNAKVSLSPSVISRQIKDLESEFGVSLFLRTPKGIKLTSQGKILFEQTEKILTEVRTTQSLIENQGNNPSEKLTLHVPTMWVSDVIISYIRDFLNLYPNIQVNIVSDEKAPNFFDQNHTIAVLPYCPTDPKLVRKFLTNFNLGLYAHPDYIAEHGTPKTVADLDQHRIIASSDQNPSFSDIDWHLKIGKNGEPRDPYIRINNLFLACDRGLGIATLAAENNYLKESKLVRILPEISGPSMNAYLVYPEMIKSLRPIRLFSQYLTEITTRLGLSPEKS